MNAELDREQAGMERLIAEALVATCSLSKDSVEQIAETMRATHLGFADAALHAGLVNAAQIEAATAIAQQQLEGRQGGVIESALQRAQSRSRALVRQGGIAKPSRQLLLVSEPDNPACEKVRALRTELMLLMEGDRRNNVIAVLSAEPSEGRSQLVAELAVAFAQLRRRTLLVDADMRRPRQHLLFNADNQWGLAQTLAAGDSPFIHEVEGVPDLSVVTAGTLPGNPLELVSNPRFERRLAEWRRNFHYVLLDTPPVSQYADALAVATAAGSVVVLGRGHSTAYSSMKDMLRRLAPTQARILGSIINTF